MFRLDNILERWAELYTPDKDKKEHPAFFRISMIDANSYFVRNYNMLGGACVAHATHVDAEINRQNPKQINYRHAVYFLVKQPVGTVDKTRITDELGATEARFSTDDMAQDLISVLNAMKGLIGGKSLPEDLLKPEAAEIRAFIEQTASDPEYIQGLRGLHTEDASWGTLPPMFNGWQICGMTLEQTVPRLLCVNPERYVKE